MLKRKKNVIEDKIIRDIRTLFESEEKDYYELVRTSNAFSNNYIEYESEGDKNKTLSTEEYLIKIRPCLSNMNFNQLFVFERY